MLRRNLARFEGLKVNPDDEKSCSKLTLGNLVVFLPNRVANHVRAKHLDL